MNGVAYVYTSTQQTTNSHITSVLLPATQRQPCKDLRHVLVTSVSGRQLNPTKSEVTWLVASHQVTTSLTTFLYCQQVSRLLSLAARHVDVILDHSTLLDVVPSSETGMSSYSVTHSSLQDPDVHFLSPGLLWLSAVCNVRQPDAEVPVVAERCCTPRYGAILGRCYATVVLASGSATGEFKLTYLVRQALCGQVLNLPYWLMTFISSPMATDVHFSLWRECDIR